jgi:hypothetical protein
MGEEGEASTNIHLEEGESVKTKHMLWGLITVLYNSVGQHIYLPGVKFKIKTTYRK